MENDIIIRSDQDGFILVQCSLCDGFFKLLAKDLNEESNLNIWCPYCGLNGKNYFTQEVIDIAMKIAKNQLNQMVYESFKELERKTKSNKLLSFKCENKPEKEIITSIKSRIEKFELKKYVCCNVQAKIKPIALEYGSYCPMCGGVDIG